MTAFRFILPDEYVETMKPLLNNVPSVDFDVVEMLFLQEFGKTPDEIFLNFERTPIAAASLAQVHRANLKDGISLYTKKIDSKF